MGNHTPGDLQPLTLCQGLTPHLNKSTTDGSSLLYAVYLGSIYAKEAKIIGPGVHGVNHPVKLYQSKETFQETT